MHFSFLFFHNGELFSIHQFMEGERVLMVWVNDHAREIPCISNAYAIFAQLGYENPQEAIGHYLNKRNKFCFWGTK